MELNAVNAVLYILAFVAVVALKNPKDLWIAMIHVAVFVILVLREKPEVQLVYMAAVVAVVMSAAVWLCTYMGIFKFPGSKWLIPIWILPAWALVFMLFVSATRRLP